MIPVVPWILELILLVTNLAIAVAVWSILSAAAGRSGLPPATQRTVRFGSAIFLAAWLGTALLLAPAPASLLGRDRFYLTPLIPLFVVVPITIALLALRLSPAVRRVVATASLPALIGVQLYQQHRGSVSHPSLAGTTSRALCAAGRRGDIAAGLTAPLVALAVARRGEGGGRRAGSWNGGGWRDRVVAVGMGTGFRGRSSRRAWGSPVPPAAAMGVFPLVLVPTFAVPVSVLLHLLALGKLRQEAQARSELMPKVAS